MNLNFLSEKLSPSPQEPPTYSSSGLSPRPRDSFTSESFTPIQIPVGKKPLDDEKIRKPSPKLFSENDKTSWVGHDSTSLAYTDLNDAYDQSIELEELDPTDSTFIINKIYNSNLNDVIVQKMISFKTKELDWDKLSKMYSITKNFIIKFIKFINWDSFIDNSKIRENDYELVNLFKDRFDWSKLSQKINLDQNFIQNNYELIVWDSIILNNTFTEDLIMKYSKKINWKLLGSSDRVLSAEFIRRNFDQLDIDSEEKITEIFSKLILQQFVPFKESNSKSTDSVPQPYEDIRQNPVRPEMRKQLDREAPSLEGKPKD
jgi:hypothetical protein